MSILDMLKEQLDPEEYRKLIETRQTMERRFMRLEESNILRILPAATPGKLWFREVPNHFRVGGADKKGVCICLSEERTTRSACFVDDVMRFYQMTGNPADMEYAKQLQPSRIYWVNAINMKSDMPVVRIATLSYTTFQQLFQMFISGETSFLDTSSQGTNVLISKQPGNKYFVRLDTVKRGPEIPEEILAQRYDLEAVVRSQIRTYEEQMAMFPPELVNRMKEAGFLSGLTRTSEILEQGTPQGVSGLDAVSREMGKISWPSKGSVKDLEDI